MAEITLTKCLESEQPLSDAIIRDTLQKILDAKFSHFTFLKKAPNTFTCRVKTKLFNPIVSLKATLQTHIREHKAKVLITADTKTNGWFWFTVLFVIFTWGLSLIVTIWMWHAQKQSSIKALQEAFDQVEFELGKI